ncbi:MAG: S8 family serine peptidase [Chitinophagaceae bacterium]|nr:S8 family serine peptidase [Chitinophagaceae bacterium]
MKSHFIIKVTRNFEKTFTGNIPYWKDFILMDKSRAVESFFPQFDNLFRSRNLNFWVTKEYEPQSATWSAEEIFAELNLIYRVILQNDYAPQPELVTQITLFPNIVNAAIIDVVETPIPLQTVSTTASIESKKNAELIYLQYAKLMTKGLPEIKIAVLDTGVNLDHKELKGKFKFAADFVNIQGLDTTGFIGDINDYDDVPEDEVGHGTHVSGIIAAKGIAMDEGVCPNCSIMPVRVLATMKNGNKLVGAGIIDNINAGIKWAVDNGADVINMSLGIKHEGGGLPHEDVIQYALKKNVTIVAASGNDGTNEKYYPGALPGVIAVGAVDDSGTVTNFTSYGADITVVAPGLNIYSSFSENTYSVASGTSQASPFVAGTVGLLKSYAKGKGKILSNDAIKYILKHSSDKPDNKQRSQKSGYGLINLADAFKLLNHLLK